MIKVRNTSGQHRPCTRLLGPTVVIGPKEIMILDSLRFSRKHSSCWWREQRRWSYIGKFGC